jgi:hypothetical protein
MRVMAAYPHTVMPIVEAFGFAVEKLNPITAETLKDVESGDEQRSRVGSD